jgi:hypothetical protein
MTDVGGAADRSSRRATPWPSAVRRPCLKGLKTRVYGLHRTLRCSVLTAVGYLTVDGFFRQRIRRSIAAGARRSRMPAGELQGPPTRTGLVLPRGCRNSSRTSPRVELYGKDVYLTVVGRIERIVTFYEMSERARNEDAMKEIQYSIPYFCALSRVHSNLPRSNPATRAYCNFTSTFRWSFD